MPKRMIDTDLWKDESVMADFTAEDRYFWLYLLTNPHNNMCGVLKDTPTLFARDMGYHKDTIVNLIYRFNAVHNMIYCDAETKEIMVLNWYKYNWNKSPKIIAIIERELATIKSTEIKRLLRERMELVQGLRDTLSIPYRYPPIPNSNSIPNNMNIPAYNTQTNTQTEKKSYKEKLTDAEKNEYAVFTVKVIHHFANNHYESDPLDFIRYNEERDWRGGYGEDVREHLATFALKWEMAFVERRHEKEKIEI